MPDPIVTGSLIAAGSSLMGNGINAYAQGKSNKKTRQFNEKMYGIQRRDALADWNMQNDYNSPTSQMARLREAGLNPNLVYGKGADNTAAPIKSPDAAPFKHEPYRITDNPVQRYFDTKMQLQQLDNLKAANTVQVQEAILKAATTANTVAQTARSKFELGQAESMSTYVLEAAKENVRKLQLEQGSISATTDKTKADTRYTLNQDERAAAQNAATLKIAAETVLKMRAETANTEQQRSLIREQIRSVQNDNELKKLDIELRKMGINPNDPAWMRITGRYLEEGVEGVKKFLQNGWEGAKRLGQSVQRNLEFTGPKNNGRKYPKR